MEEVIKFENVWIDVNERWPDEDELVWCYSSYTKHIFLGCISYFYNEGWFWGAIDGGTYIYQDKICGDCSIDDLDVTHWMPLPKPPQK